MAPCLVDYRAALAVVLVPIVIGVVGVLVARQRVRTSAGIVVPSLAAARERRRGS